MATKMAVLLAGLAVLGVTESWASPFDFFVNGVYEDYRTTVGHSSADKEGLETRSTGKYPGSGYKIAWKIIEPGRTDQGGHATYWTYSYSFTTPAGGELTPNLSHFILEVSADFTSGDLIDPQGDIVVAKTEGPAWFSKGASSPNMPGSIFGIKFENQDPADGSTDVAFLSPRGPTWVDFYTKAASDRNLSEAWNKGLAHPDLPLSNPYTHWIAGPDTDPGFGGQAVPEPGAFLLFGLGALGLIARRRWCAVRYGPGRGRRRVRTD